jgi:hypothetical protein
LRRARRKSISAKAPAIGENLLTAAPQAPTRSRGLGDQIFQDVMGVEETKEEEAESSEELGLGSKKRRYSLIPNSKRKSLNTTKTVLRDRSNVVDSIDETEKTTKKQKVHITTESDKTVDDGVSGHGPNGNENHFPQNKLRRNSVNTTRRLANRAL